MKKKYVVFIILGLGLLFLCFNYKEIIPSLLPPKANFEKSESIWQSKRVGSFVDEYVVDKIEVLDSTYSIPIFKHIWLENRWKRERNWLGLYRPVVVYCAGQSLRFQIDNKKSTDLTLENYLFNTQKPVWKLKSVRETLGISTDLITTSLPLPKDKSKFCFTLFVAQEYPSNRSPTKFTPAYKIEIVPKKKK